MMMDSNNNSDYSDDTLAREELLIARVVDDEAGPDDWSELEALAVADAGVWQRLARAQREHAVLEREVDDAISIAELVDLPAEQMHGFHLSYRIQRYAGWAVAAVMGLALLTTLGVSIGNAPAPGGASTAGVGFTPISSATPDEAIDQYVRSSLAQGNLVGEMPTVLLKVRALPDGAGQEVTYVRQFVERRTLADVSVVTPTTDEFGTTRYVSRSLESFQQANPESASPVKRAVGRTF